MDHSQGRFRLLLTLITAANAACAMIGWTFLVVGPTGGNALSLAIVIPVGAALLTSLLLLVERHLVQRARDEFVQAMKVDSATSLPSSYLAEHVLATEFNAAQRGRPFSVVLLEVDDFQRFGLALREQLLLLAGRVLKRRMRGMNTSARYGAGEARFVCVLSNVPLEGACVFVKRVLKDLAGIPSADRPVKMSVGIAPFHVSMESPNAMLAAADRALAKAKQEGGNRVVMWVPKKRAAASRGPQAN